MIKWFGRLLIFLGVLIAGGLIAGQVARYNLARQFPPPGTMVESNGHRLHVHCEGRGPVTVLLSAGLNDFSVQWSRVQPLLAKETRTCAYDRAGLGWSDVSQNPATLQNAVSDLQAVLQSEGDQQPVILVGHSYGSLPVRAYAQQHPQNIKAIVLLDPSSEFMAEKITGYTEALDKAAEQFGSLASLASLGFIAFSTESIPANQLQGKALNQYRAVLATGNFFKAASAETAAMRSSLKAMQTVPQTALADIPIVIISRGQPEPIPGLPEQSAQTLEQTWATLQTDLVQRLHARQIFAKQSGHNIQLSQPDLVYESVKQFITGS